MATISRREALNVGSERSFSHPGLALARYLKTLGEEHSKDKLTDHEKLLNLMSESKANDSYQRAFDRWTGVMKQKEIQILEAELTSPLAIGLGNESVTEIGLTTHHTYGMPVVPGSSLKGVCRKGAERLRKAGEQGDKQSKQQFNALFGDTNNASYFTFWDAWYDPASVNGKPFHRDVITVHHPLYYRARGEKELPTDFDDPTPLPFLVIKPGARFLFAIDGPTDWTDSIKKLLLWSLANVGVGGKTNAGYGYFKPFDPAGQVVSSASSVSERTNEITTEEWSGVSVVFNAGNGELTAISREGQRANCSQKESAGIRANLPENFQQALAGKKRTLTEVTVTVVKEGNRWKIVAIK
jgi:CRISPR-associated protein Cmr6